MLANTDLTALLGPASRGKVRDNYDLGDGRVVLVTTDRLSAFDRVLGTVPHKGQVLNQLAAWWFEQLRDIVAGHLLAVPDPNVTVAARCTPLPVEVVVRGYLTGVTTTALWPRYEAGKRVLYGLALPDGLTRNDELPDALITPTTKAAAGQHDEPIASVDVVARGLVERELWDQTCDVALALFARGQARARQVGLTLVDTKYEFGVDTGGALTLIDEVHTPDSSRYWRSGTTEPQDKEFVRIYYAGLGYRGDGPPPPLPADVGAELGRRYVQVFEALTGTTFQPGSEPAEPRIEANLRRWLAHG